MGEVVADGLGAGSVLAVEAGVVIKEGLVVADRSLLVPRAAQVSGLVVAGAPSSTARSTTAPSSPVPAWATAPGARVGGLQPQPGLDDRHDPLGVDDTSSSSATTTFTVHVDGDQKVTETLRLGEVKEIEVPVEDALRLRIEAESENSGIYPVWADPTLLSD
ncbi:hypothetical protein GCM10009603_53520 [Nocardiopsis exhalans]